MRAAPLALACLLLLAGCLEAQGDPPELSTDDDGTVVDDSRAIAFHRWTACAECADAGISRDQLFVVMDDARVYLVDVAPGNGTDSGHALDAIVRASGNGVIDRVSEGTIDPGLVAEIDATILTGWPREVVEGGPCLERLCPATFGRPDNGTWEPLRVERADPSAPGNEALARLFLLLVEAERAVGLAAPVAQPPEDPRDEPKQGGTPWQGQDSELGSIRAPSEVQAFTGTRVPLDAQVVLRQLYEEKDARFFLFAWSVENTPLDITWEKIVRGDTGDELPCYRREGSATTSLKCFVDLKDMPPAGTEILFSAQVTSMKTGQWPAGATVVPFSHTWSRIPMENGLEAELYAVSMVSVESPQASSG